MDLSKIIEERFAVRKFSSRKLEPEVLAEILEAGRLAPTAKNMQPQRIFVCKSDEALAKIDLVSPCRYNSSCVLLVCGDTNDCFTDGAYTSHEMDATIVTTHMMLKATDVGADSLWVRRFDVEKTKEVFNLKDGIIPVCLLVLGYRTVDCPMNVKHNVRKPLNETVTEL